MYRLADIEALNDLEPRTVEFGVGAHVKLLFDFPDEEASEAMWVTVETIEGDRLIGSLANDAACGLLSFGDHVDFETRHIVGVMPARPRAVA